MKARTKIFLDKYHPKQNGTCQVKLEVYFNRKRKYYLTDVELTPDQYEKVMYSKRRNSEQAEVYKRLSLFKSKADQIIDEHSVFTFGLFESAYLENRDVYTDLAHAFNKRIADLRAEGKIGTAVTYECAITSLQEYRPNLTFADITPVFLHKYEKEMLNKGRSKTTIGMYLRNLRAIYNSQNISSTLYPFGKGKYEIPTGKNIKKALDLSDIIKIFQYKATTKTEEHARDLWIFLYLSNGMNVKDLCLLKWENIEGEVLKYERAKTANTKDDPKPIEVHLKPQSKAIISKYGTPSLSKKGYVFSFLTPSMTPEQQRKVYQQVTKTINKYIGRIAEKLGIEEKVTTYSARHSFATILQRSGADISMISTLLGHSKIAVTENYLKGFETEVVREKTDALTQGF